jgi:Ceramidase
MNRFGYVILLAWLGLTLIFVDTAAAPKAWSEWPSDYCLRTNCYCEPLRLDRLVAQPIATYSNFGFMAVGLLILWATFKRPPAPTSAVAAKPYGTLFGLVLIGTGVFSFFYHASLTKIGDYLDLMGVYLLLSLLLLFNFNRLSPMKPLAFALTYGALNLGLAVGLWLAYDLQQVYFVVLIVGLLTLEALAWRKPPSLDRRWVGGALALFAAGAAVWVLDGNGGLPCFPSAPISWHAVWHVCAAGAAGLMYLYYRSSVQSQRRTVAL